MSSDLKRAEAIAAQVREQYGDPNNPRAQERADDAIARALKAEGLYDVWKEAQGR